MRGAGRQLTPRAAVPGPGGIVRLAATAVAAASFATAGCTGDVPRESGNPADSLLQAVLGLSEEAHVHRIVLTGRGAEERVVPLATPIIPGDYVEFYVADGRVHTVSFVEDSLGTAGLEFLRGTSQLSSPPLLERQARFVLTFEDAPPGRYPFVSAAHGDTVRGEITVQGTPGPGPPTEAGAP